MQQNNIVSVNKNPVFQSAIQSDTARVVSENKSPPSTSSNALTLTVLNVGRNNVQLQVQGTKERFSIPLSSLQIDGELNKGDLVLLTAVKNNVAKLVVVEPALQSLNTFKDIKASPVLLRQLAANWSQLTLSELSRINIKPSFDAAINNSNVQDKLINWLFQNGQDALKNKYVELVIKSITKNANSVTIALDSGRSNSLIEIKLPKEWLATLDRNSSLTIRLNADPERAVQRVLVGGMLIDKKPVPIELLRQINQDLSKADRIAVEKTFKQSFLTSGVSRPERESVVFKPNDVLLDSLRLSSSQRNTIANMDMQAALVRPSNSINSMPQLLLYAKPTIVKTNAENLQSVSSFTNSSRPASPSGTANTVATSATPLNAAEVSNAAAKSTENGTLVKNVPDGNKSAAIQAALNQKVVILDGLVNDDKRVSSQATNSLAGILGKASPETRQVFQSLMGTRLRELTGSRFGSGSAPQMVKNVLGENAPEKSSDVVAGKTDVKSTAAPVAEGQKLSYTSELVKQLVQDQLLSPLSPQAPTNTSSAGGQASQANTMVEGLINMLSLRLMSKFDGELKNALPALSMLRGLMQNPKSALNNTQTKNAATEFEKLDSNNELLKSLSNANIRHQSNLLRSLDSMLQQQDTLYFTLPNIIVPDRKDIELKIRPINDWEETNGSNSYQRNWLIDMRLDIGKEGDILAKIKLTGTNVELNLYASEQALMRKTNKLLPHLVTRLNGFGLNIVERRCYFSKNTEAQISENQTNSNLASAIESKYLQRKNGIYG